MNPSERPAPDPDGRRFSLAVWPQTASRPWHAEVTDLAAVGPRHFDRPIDLLLYLTELPGDPPSRHHGLR